MKWFHLFFISTFLLGAIVWGIIGFFRSRKELPLAKPSYSKWKLLFNSAVLYALAYNLIFFIQEFFLAFGKYLLGLKAWLYHNNHNWDGDHPEAALAQGLGAVAIFFCGVLALFVFLRSKQRSKWTSVFLLWFSFQGFMQSLPQFATAVDARDTDVGQAFDYLQIGDVAGYVIGVVLIFFQIFLCICYSKWLLGFAPEKEAATKKSRFRYLFYMVFFAGLFALAIIFPFRIMPFERALAPLFAFLISIPWVFANAWNIKNAASANNEINHRVIYLPVILLAVLLIYFQLVLAKGVLIF